MLKTEMESKYTFTVSHIRRCHMSAARSHSLNTELGICETRLASEPSMTVPFHVGTHHARDTSVCLPRRTANNSTAFNLIEKQVGWEEVHGSYSIYHHSGSVLGTACHRILEGKSDCPCPSAGEWQSWVEKFTADPGACA